MTTKIIYQFDEFYFDIGSQAFFFKNEEIKLEPRVFDVLHLMLKRPNQLITKGEFFEYVWQGKVVSDWALMIRIQLYTLNLKCITSPSLTK